MSHGQEAAMILAFLAFLASLYASGFVATLIAATDQRWKRAVLWPLLLSSVLIFV